MSPWMKSLFFLYFMRACVCEKVYDTDAWMGRSHNCQGIGVILLDGARVAGPLFIYLVA